MNIENEALLSDYVEISRQFLRSVRLDTDFGREDALQGYICQGTARSLLESMSNQIVKTKQRAFTWTGPYGGGKSSLALVLCSLVSENPIIRAKAQDLLGINSDHIINQAFPAGSGWKVLPVVGSRDSVASSIDHALNTANSSVDNVEKKPGRPKLIRGKDVINKLVNEAESHENGLLLVIDELGKFLESSAQAGEDVYFYQELAEAASRTNGRLIVIGILHQAFEEYALRLGSDARNEWAKVQGRYIDIPLVSATDEVIELISRAITHKKKISKINQDKVTQTIVSSIKRHRPGVPTNLESGLIRCWPLHPITASLIGPISKRRFGQNERSTFGFLASREPLGFTEFLHSEKISGNVTYGPARYWDYLKANLEPSILSSPDGHKWSAAAEAVERAEVKGSRLHADIVKVISLIEIFKNGSGLSAEFEVLENSFEGGPNDLIKSLLTDLEKWSIVVYRKHLSAWGIYSGSDFDIDAATTLAKSKIDATSLNRLSELSERHPIIAKRLYQESGTMRWFSKAIVLSSNLESYLAEFELKRGSAGEFILVIPTKDTSKRALEKLIVELSIYEKKPFLLGLPSNAERISELGIDLTALELVRTTSPELENDGVARREIDARISLVKVELESLLSDAFSQSLWYFNLEKLDTSRGLSSIASQVAEFLYPHTPALYSELLNRDVISSNAKAALRDLLHRMLSHSNEENLGYVGYPADAGLYYTVVKSSGFHQVDNEVWRFTSPKNTKNSVSFNQIWSETTRFLSESSKTVKLADLYDFWAAIPYGMRRGVMPVLALVFFLANRQHLAMYVEGVFQPELNDLHLDEWLQDPKRIGFRYVEIDGYEKELLAGLSAALTQRLGYDVNNDPLDSARGLVSLAYKLPAWTQRTNTISVNARDVRQILLHAKDPHKVLFIDLPTKFGKQGKELVEKVVEIIEELANAYPKMLKLVESTLLDALDHKGDIPSLIKRAETVKGITGDFTLEAFVARLEEFDSAGSIEGLISLALSKRTSDALDREIDTAILQLSKWAHEFRVIESLASVRGRISSRRAISVVFGAGQGKTVTNTFDVSETDLSVIDEIATSLMTSLKTTSVKNEVLLAALAEAGTRLIQSKE